MAGGEAAPAVTEVTVALSPPRDPTLLPKAAAGAQPGLVGAHWAGSWTGPGVLRAEEGEAPVPQAALLEFVQTAVVCSAPTD